MFTPLRWFLPLTVVLAAYPDRWQGWGAQAQSLPKPYAIDGYTYLGCYFEPQGYRMLNDTFSLDYGMSGCQDWCRRQNMRYAGMELGDQCFCGNTFTPKDGWQKDESKCDQLCYQNTDEVCGGFGWMALYSRGGASLPTQSKPSPTPQPQPQPQPAPSSSPPQSSAASPPQQQPQAPASSSSLVQQPLITASKTQDLRGPSSSSASENAVSSEAPNSSASSESQLLFTFGSSTGTAAPIQSSLGTSSQLQSGTVSSQASTLAPVAPLLPLTTAMGDVPGATPHFKDRKQIPLMGVNLVSAAQPQLDLQPTLMAFMASVILFSVL